MSRQTTPEAKSDVQMEKAEFHITDKTKRRIIKPEILKVDTAEETLDVKSVPLPRDEDFTPLLGELFAQPCARKKCKLLCAIKNLLEDHQFMRESPLAGQTKIDNTSGGHIRMFRKPNWKFKTKVDPRAKKKKLILIVKRKPNPGCFTKFQRAL